ncbi:MAG: HAMP domain-containing sensor histidine kinase [Pseudomonadota bacterium]
MQSLTKSYVTQIFSILLPFSISVAVIYTLLISGALLFVEDYVLHGYLEREFTQLKDTANEYDENIKLPSTSYMRSYWENDPALPYYVKELDVGTHETQDSLFHVFVGKLPNVNRKVYIVLEENKISSIEQYTNVINLALWSIALVIIFASVFVAYFVAKIIAKPVGKLAADVTDELYPKKQFHGSDRVDEIGKLSRSFSGLVNQLQDSLDIEKSFTRHSSHEMRTPMAVIRNAVSVLKLPNCSEEKKLRNLERIEKACIDSERMLDVFLTLGKDNANLPKENISLLSITESIIENHSELINEKNLEVTLSGENSGFIHAPLSLVEVVLNNLLRNALYYGRKVLSIDIDNKNITLANKIETAPSSANKFGYGLEIVRRICELNGWKFYIQCDDSNFIVRLDFAQN